MKNTKKPVNRKSSANKIDAFSAVMASLGFAEILERHADPGFKAKRAAAVNRSAGTKSPAKQSAQAKREQQKNADLAAECDAAINKFCKDINILVNK